MVDRLVTVGVYGFTAERFLAALKRADVGLLFDVRQRRGISAKAGHRMGRDFVRGDAATNEQRDRGRVS
jgi:hypothetical protein